MTLEEKQALQTILVDECIQRQQEAPTLLIDALLGEQGNALIHHVLSRRLAAIPQELAATQQRGQLYSGLLKVLMGTRPVITPREEDVA